MLGLNLERTSEEKEMNNNKTTLETKFEDFCRRESRIWLLLREEESPIFGWILAVRHGNWIVFKNEHRNKPAVIAGADIGCYGITYSAGNS